MFLSLYQQRIALDKILFTKGEFFMDAEELIEYIIELFTEYLDELEELPLNDFIHGEKTAYVETLEIIQAYKKVTPEKLK